MSELFRKCLQKLSYWQWRLALDKKQGILFGLVITLLSDNHTALADATTINPEFFSSDEYTNNAELRASEDLILWMVQGICLSISFFFGYLASKHLSKNEYYEGAKAFVASIIAGGAMIYARSILH